MESLSGWANYKDFKTSMAAAVAALKTQGLISILSTARDGWNTKVLQDSWPGVWAKDEFTDFQLTIVPLFDVYSPQCYSTGFEDILFACRPDNFWNYSGYYKAQQIWPAISGNWIRTNADAGKDPVAVLTGLGPASGFPTEPHISGFLVWNGVDKAPVAPPPDPTNGGHMRYANTAAGPKRL